MKIKVYAFLKAIPPFTGRLTLKILFYYGRGKARNNFTSIAIPNTHKNEVAYAFYHCLIFHYQFAGSLGL